MGIDDDVAHAGQRFRTAYSKQALSGQPLSIVHADEVGLDCQTIGLPTLEVVGRPQHGRTVVTHVKVHPTFPRASPFAKCNTELVDGLEMYYRSDEGFVGTDHVTALSRMQDGYHETAITIRVVGNPQF